MSPLLIPDIPLSLLVLLNVGGGGGLFYHLKRQHFSPQWRVVREDLLAMCLGYCCFTIFLGLAIAFDSLESTRELDVLTGLGGGLKFGMVGILGGQLIVSVFYFLTRKPIS